MGVIPFNDPVFVARWRTYVDPTTNLWTGYRDRDGYGIFTWPGPTGERLKFRAHRVAWAIAEPAAADGCDPPCDRVQHPRVLQPGLSVGWDRVRKRG